MEAVDVVDVMFNKLLLLLIKYVPIIQMLAMLINNTLYYITSSYTAAYTIDFIFGNSLIFTILLLMISYRFNYCEWHRLIIIGNIINVAIASYDATFGIPFTDMQLLLTYYIIACIFILAAAYTHIKQIHHERKAKIAKTTYAEDD